MKNFKNIIFVISLLTFMFNIINPNLNKKIDIISYPVTPTIFLYGDMDEMNSKEDERVVSLSYLSKDISFIKTAKIKIQGSSTIYYKKKNYTINLYDDKELENKFKVDMGWGEHSKYVLKANWSDKTHSRNIVSARIISSVSEKYNLFESAPNNASIDGFPVDVYLNGEFLGLYTFNLPKTDWMLGLDDKDEKNLAFVGQTNRDECFFRKAADYYTWELEVGEENAENLSKFNRLYYFVNNSSDVEFKMNFSNYFDLNAMLNYYVLVDTFMLEDNIGKNMILLTYDGMVWYPVLYDMDASFGVNPSGKFIYEYQNVSFEKNLLLSRFENVFWNEICDRYKELRKDILTTQNINKEIDLFYNSISKESFEKENDRWENIPGFDVSQMKEFVSKRFIYLDEYFN